MSLLCIIPMNVFVFCGIVDLFFAWKIAQFLLIFFGALRCVFANITIAFVVQFAVGGQQMQPEVSHSLN